VTLAFGVVAVGVGWTIPAGGRLRRLAPPPAVPVDASACGLVGTATPLLEPVTGRLDRIASGDGGTLDQASFAPWRDEHGGTQLVGRWVRRHGADVEVGIARLTFPGGRWLDRIPTDMLPTGPPCWVPGTAARVLFPAGDGRLYRLDFEAGRELSRPSAVAWDIAEPGPSRVRLSDPSWADDRRLAGRLLVALNVLTDDGEPQMFRPAQVWWVRLDPGDSAIIAAGPVTRDDGRYRRFPTLAPDGRGGLVLVSLACRAGEDDWSLLVEPLAFDPETGAPRAVPGAGRVLAGGLRPTPPAVARDGSAVAVMVRDGAAARPVRIELPRPGDPAAAHTAHAAGISSSESLRQPSPTTTGGSSQRTFGTTRGT
jgi:hypothetical protein